jgi:uncharacterized protein (TIGR02453 family)
MIVSQIQESSLEFLKHLTHNNNRTWFEANKERFLAAQQNMIAFADHLLFLMNTHDFIENESGKKSLYRIYSDVRFKKDKSPYNTRFAIGLRRATKWRRGYFQ